MKEIETKVNNVKSEHKKLIENEIKMRHFLFLFLNKNKLREYSLT